MEAIKQHWGEIENANLVHDYFNKFPSLHDTEVIEIRLDRELGFDFTGPKLYLKMYVFDSDVALDDPQRKNSILDFVFTQVEVQDISGFNHQNPISDFHMERYDCARLKAKRWRIRFGEMGTNVEFTCKQILVAHIQPFEPIDYYKK